MAKRFDLKNASEMPPMSISLGDMSFNKTGSWRYLRPRYEEKLAPCRAACPLGTDIPRVLNLVSQGKFAAAQTVIRQTNPFPGVLGRVCYHACESACSRLSFDDALSIRALERFVSEACSALPKECPPPERRNQRVAVVGSGPAGLACAYYLAKEGFLVQVFEADGHLGGMLRQGIPRYRLPRSVLEREIANIASLGVQFTTRRTLGQDLQLKSLEADYDAVFIATGAHASRRLGIEGEGLAGIWAGLDFLKSVNRGEPPPLGRVVLVIGGGNTAMDSARVAVRLGASTTVLYRRTREQMPATLEEIEQAHAEGVQMHFLANPIAICRDGNKLELTCVRMQLKGTDGSGRPAPVPVDGSEFHLVADTVIKAIGETPHLDWRDRKQLNLGAQTPILQSGKVFVGGDAAAGPTSVAEAARDGREVAWAILRLLDPKASPRRIVPAKPLLVDQINLDYFRRQRRLAEPELAPSDRTIDFSEVIQSLPLQGALVESHRCFGCGVCDHCDNCWTFCPDASIQRVNGEYAVNLESCKGCGICSHECPRGVISLVQEIQ